MQRKRQPAPPGPQAHLLKKGASSLQPDVWRLGEGENARVWKTYRESHFLLRATVCRWMAAREARNLRLLSHMEGVPRLLSRPEPWTIEMTWLNAETLPDSKSVAEVEPAYFERLWEMISEMHRRRLNHGDLRRKNLLRDAVTKQPLLIDFTQSMHSRSGNSLFHSLILRRAFEVDRLKFLKLKKWYLGASNLTPAELQELARVPMHLRFGQFLRKSVYRPFKHWRTGKTKKTKRAS